MMTKKFYRICGILVLFLLMSSVSALDAMPMPITGEVTSQQISELIDIYNENLDKVPGIVISMFGNERVNLYVDGELVYGFVTKDGRVIEEFDGGLEKPGLNLHVKEAGFDQITAGNMSIGEALNKKDISYEGVGFFNKMKYGLAKTFQGFTGNVVFAQIYS